MVPHRLALLKILTVDVGEISSRIWLGSLRRITFPMDGKGTTSSVLSHMYFIIILLSRTFDFLPIYVLYTYPESCIRTRVCHGTNALLSHTLCMLFMISSFGSCTCPAMSSFSSLEVRSYFALRFMELPTIQPDM